MSKLSKALLPLGVVALFLLPSVASAQVIYAPVQYQYKISYAGRPDVTFYYGGSNPLVFERADQIACQNQWNTGTREGEYGVGLLHRGLIGRPPYLVFSDCAPLQNAAVYGMTPADARNEAYARAPRYFTKAGLLSAAMPAVEPEHYTKWTPDGLPANGSRVWIVPAQGWPMGGDMAPGIEIRRVRNGASSRPSTAPAATVPASEPKPLLIIPKSLLEQPKTQVKPVSTTPQRSVAVAQ
jgi:hypothetical protein